jgi:hypothetical protein
MNSNPNDFEALRKLMALKRHEQPPPAYLNQLSNRIITRIERGEGQLTLWEKVSANFSLRPTVACAFGLTVCGALGLSAVYAIRQQVAETANASGAMTLRIPTTAAVSFVSSERPEAAPLHVANWLGKTNPATELQPELSLFHPTRAAMPVSYQPGN